MRKLTKHAKPIILIIIIGLLIYFFPKIDSLFSNIENIVGQSGAFGPIVYMLLMALAVVISPIPSSPLAILAGIFFGPTLGMLYTLIGATLGALIAFSIARFFLRDYLSKKMEKNKIYAKIKGKNEKNIAIMVLITRLMPHVSFDIVSYAAGLTNLRIFTFALVTFIGMIPIVFLLSFFGSLIQPHLARILLLVSIVFVLYLLYLIFKEKGTSQPV